MKKLKLFLLTFIVCLFGVSFSNANVLDFNVPDEKVVNISSYGYLDLPNGQILNIVNKTPGKQIWIMRGRGGEIVGYCNDSCFVDTTNQSLVLRCYAGSNCKVLYSYYAGKNIFTPAMNGLKGTVIELIPYVIYISIGLLLVTIGFYAIRRLINWLGGKVKSNFISKRK